MADTIKVNFDMQEDFTGTLRIVAGKTPPLAMSEQMIGRDPVDPPVTDRLPIALSATEPLLKEVRSSSSSIRATGPSGGR